MRGRKKERKKGGADRQGRSTKGENPETSTQLQLYVYGSLFARLIRRANKKGENFWNSSHERRRIKKRRKSQPNHSKSRAPRPFPAGQLRPTCARSRARSSSPFSAWLAGNRKRERSSRCVLIRLRLYSFSLSREPAREPGACFAAKIEVSSALLYKLKSQNEF